MLAMGVEGFQVQSTKLFKESVNLNNLNKPIIYFDSAGDDENTCISISLGLAINGSGNNIKR